MEFLLALSALLSALTGAFTASRPSEVRLDCAEARLVAIAEAVSPAEVVAVRPEQPLSSVARLSSFLPETTFTLPHQAPLAFVRLIE